MMGNEIYTWETDVLAICLRYFLLAGIAYLLYYIPTRLQLKVSKIQSAEPSHQQITREILHSCSTLIIYCATSWLVFRLYENGFTHIYTQGILDDLPYAVFSFVLCILVHDAYFYWTHRLIHHPRLYLFIHRTHHLSTNPTPWASFAFHPLEAMLSIGIIP
ncbi:MAG: sterol desaturase family protein, partial [Flavobacteriales bacterium]